MKFFSDILNNNRYKLAELMDQSHIVVMRAIFELLEVLQFIKKMIVRDEKKAVLTEVKESKNSLCQILNATNEKTSKIENDICKILGAIERID